MSGSTCLLRWAKSRDSYHRIASQSSLRFESLAFVGGHVSPQNTEISPQRPCVRCAAIHYRAIGVHPFNIRCTWNCGMACES